MFIVWTIWMFMASGNRYQNNALNSSQRSPSVGATSLEFHRTLLATLIKDILTKATKKY
jgi:hypothetical protein